MYTQKTINFKALYTEHVVQALNTEWRIYIPKKRLTHFKAFTGRFNHFIGIQEEFPHPLNGCWT